MIVKQGEIRANIKKYFDMAYEGEYIVVPRKDNKNVVIISEESFEQMRGYTYALGVRVFTDDRGSSCPLGHFGWDGAAGFYVMIDPRNNLTYVYAQDVLQSGITFHLIHRQLRDLTYLCMRE